MITPGSATPCRWQDRQQDLQQEKGKRLMKSVCIFRHIDCEGPGYFARVLDDYNIPYRLVCIDQGEIPPTDPTQFSALVFMGGSMSVNDPLPWIAQELALIRQATAIDMPVLGHCLGGQLISKALGGVVSPNPVREIGWLPVQKIPSPLADDWLPEYGEEQLLFHWHGETFTIPAQATAILSTPACQHQGFVRGNTLALQCHIEMTTAMVREWVQRNASELQPPSATIQFATVQSADDISADLEARIAHLEQIAARIYRRWLQPLLAGQPVSR